MSTLGLERKSGEWKVGLYLGDGSVSNQSSIYEIDGSICSIELFVNFFLLLLMAPSPDIVILFCCFILGSRFVTNGAGLLFNNISTRLISPYISSYLFL